MDTELPFLKKAVKTEGQYPIQEGCTEQRVPSLEPKTLGSTKAQTLR